uniref:Uncharacterized protein n=1 Tax=Anguilla anguilla TaxID=7936 RepID=A0A0E9Q2V7_ANGAN
MQRVLLSQFIVFYSLHPPLIAMTADDLCNWLQDP